ncbi:response regulator [Chelatococcus reniformis]|nr:response regulator [Chelatococcus reniformis]
MSGDAIGLLLLEDSDIDAELIAHQLAKLGRHVEVDRAAVRGEFQQRLAQRRYDAILSDYSLPDFAGIEALQVARAAQPDVPFIFVSGVLGEERATEALRAGATDYVTKRDLGRLPMVTERALREALERRLGQRAMQALRESEERFRNMADSAPALIWSVGPDGTMTFANRRFETELGVPSARMLREGWAALLHEDDWPAFAEKRRAAIAAREVFADEMRVRCASGEVRWLKCQSSPRHDDAGRFLGYTGCAVDITEARVTKHVLEVEVLKRTEELRDKDEALRQSQKMEAIGQLTGGIAHDFNNMLAGILGGAELIQRRLAEGRFEDCERYLDAVVMSAKRAAGLTQRLLAFSRRQTLNVRGSDINALVASLEDLLHRTIGSSIQLTITFDHDLWPASTDANQLESALLNLAINARDAMPDGGRLVIATRNLSIGPSEAAPGLKPGEYVAVDVVDDGAGMSADVKAKVFDPFFTTKPLGQGTGLGLSMIYGFMAQTEGQIRLTSELGEGTTVTLLLPRAGGVTDHEAPRTPAHVTSGKGSILLVEDEPAVRMLIIDHLREAGYRVLATDGAIAALALLEEERVDLLLTDVGLPGMNGGELARRARMLHPELRVLFATGYAGDTANRPDLAGDGTDLIVKPFDLPQLSERLRALLDHVIE